MRESMPTRDWSGFRKSKMNMGDWQMKAYETQLRVEALQFKLDELTGREI